MSLAIQFHPGEILKEDYLGLYNLDSSQFATRIGVPPAAIDLIVEGRAPITASLALLLGAFFDEPASNWVNLQSNYDLWLAEKLKGN